jgi:glycosyltransferase involved in cell wall biosynthesis
MQTRPKLSVVIPIHSMKGGAEFLWRSIQMLTKQTFQDYELIIVQKGKMAETTNKGIKKAKGEIIKLLCLDDMLADENSLQDIVDSFTSDVNWMINACDNNLNPIWTEHLEIGNNKLGGMSAVTIRNGLDMYFDENLSWLIDCDFYKRMSDIYGLPKILNKVVVKIGLGDHQVTNIMSDEEKEDEYYYMAQKHG